MSDEHQPLRLKPRIPAPGGSTSGGGAPPDSGLPPLPGPGAPPPPSDQDGAGRLRLKPKLNLPEEPQPAEAQPAAPPEPVPAPPPEPPQPDPPESPESEQIPKFKLRPKAQSAPATRPQSAIFEEADAPPLDEIPVAPLPDGLPPPPEPPAPPVSLSMPPMSVLAPPAGAAAAPEPPGMPKLSVGGHGPEKTATPLGLHIKVTEGQPKKAAGRPAIKPGRPPGKIAKPAVLKKRAALGPVAKVGIGVLALAVAAGGFFAYRILFGSADGKPARPSATAAELKSAESMRKKAVDAPSKLIDGGEDAIARERAAQQAKIDAELLGDDTTPTPAAGAPTSHSMLAATDLNKDVKVSDVRIDTTSTASADFRAFVANANVGGVVQGAQHAKALINGRVVREGQILDSVLGITFDRVDTEKKIIYFRDTTGAEVSKNY